VRLHPDGEWAEVELERPHTIDGGHKLHNLNVPLAQIVVALLLLLLFVAPAQAQDLGSVGLRTINKLLANNATCTGTLQLFTVPNGGQISHQAFAESNAPTFTMEIDGSDGFVNQYRISNPQVSFNLGGGFSTYIIQGSGYYPLVIVAVTCTPASSFTLSYSGSQTAAANLVTGPPGGSTTPLGGSLSNVQGIVAQQASGGAVNPVINGALQLAINTNFLAVGIDNFNTGAVGVPAGSAGTFTVDTVPTPTGNGEFAIAFEANVSDIVATTPVAPWACVPGLAGSCGAGAPQLSMAFLASVPAGQKYQRTFQNSTPVGQDVAAIVLFSSPTTAIRQANIAGSNAVSYTSNTLAKSTLIGAVRCSGTTPCTVSSVADTQGNTWNPVTTLTFNNGTQAAGIVVWASSTLSTAAADTVTFTMGSGSAAGSEIAELTGTTASTITQPSISLMADSLGALVTREDAQFPNQFVCSVPLTTATTTQCQPVAATINNIPVRAYVTDIQVNTTTTGTASAVQLVTGTGSNCGTGTANLSAITYSTVTAAAPTLVSFLGMRTPLIAPLGAAVCVKQTGTPATVTVEVHGFFAP
jgi:hypothetical protein